jgi:hypothetical protein
VTTPKRRPEKTQPDKLTVGDPLDVNARLYRQIARLLDDLESADRDGMMTMPQRIAALIAVGRVQIMFANLRKNAFNDGSVGSAVRKYSAAFARPHAARGGKDHAGPGGAGFGDDDDGDPDAA